MGKEAGIQQCASVVSIGKSKISIPLSELYDRKTENLSVNGLEKCLVVYKMSLM